MDMLGQSLGRRAIGVSIKAKVIWKYKELLVAEAPAMNTALEGRLLKDTRLREMTGLTVVGVWERGRFSAPQADLLINTTTVLMVAGSSQQLQKYEEHFGTYCAKQSAEIPVLIIGGGRVGRAAAFSLAERGIAYRIVEKSPNVVSGNEHAVQGNAADIGTLNKAGIKTARSVIITTHSDDINIYLTIYCRQLRPDIQIIARATNENTVSKLHRGGADLVMSYASIGANTILNHLKSDEVLMSLEGLSVFKMVVPDAIIGKTLIESNIRKDFGCSVVAITVKEKMNLSPEPDVVLERGAELILIGTAEAEDLFMKKYS
jgi:Trk K+ transport system NAD-binding subunit